MRGIVKYCNCLVQYSRVMFSNGGVRFSEAWV